MAITDTVRNISLVSSMGARMLYDRFSGSYSYRTNAGEGAIVITGGELFNKGAQAMTYTVVDEVAKRHPNKDVYLLSDQDYHRTPEEKNRYKFDILPGGSEIQLSLLAPSLNPINTREYTKDIHRSVRNVFEDCHMILDVSGYVLSSQMGAGMSFSYLTNIAIAKKYNIPMYILPQSIGPFNYSFPMKCILDPLMKTYLQYPEIICPREQDGVDSLDPYTSNNVRREFDIVLQCSQYELNNIYNTSIDTEVKGVPDGAVGIIPNSKVFERTSSDEFYFIYEQIIGLLLELDKEIYVLRHSKEDLELCREIYELFENSEHVHLFNQNFDAPELETLISEFEFLVASRYHSIIHGYKHSVPVIAIGWAVKYEELLSRLGQERYFFDIRDEFEIQILLDSIVKMNEESSNEAKAIENKVNRIRNHNVFDATFAQGSEKTT